MAHIEAVGIALAHLRHPIAGAPSLAETFGSQDQPVVLDFEFDVAADGLTIERIFAVPVRAFGFARRCRRGQLIDEFEETCRFERVRREP